MKTSRAQLTGSRRSLPDYAKSLDEIPKDIKGLGGTVDDLLIYPIKALGPVRIESAVITSAGLEDVATGFRDRMVMLALRKPGSTNGQEYEYQRFSQRDEPALSRFSVRIGGSSMHLETLQNSQLNAIPRNILEPRDGRQVSVLMNDDGEVIQALETPRVQPVRDWIRSSLRKLVSDPAYSLDDIELLVPTQDFRRAPEAHNRAGQAAETLFSDGGQLLVASEATLRWVNSLLKTEYGDRYRKIFMAAFRPNIVLETAYPHLEDLIKLMTIGQGSEAVDLLFAALCVRCPVTQVERISGSRPDKEPLKVLQKRPARPDGSSNKVTFGVNAVVSPEMWGRTITRGMPFTVQQEKPAVARKKRKTASKR